MIRDYLLGAAIGVAGIGGMFGLFDAWMIGAVFLAVAGVLMAACAVIEIAAPVEEYSDDEFEYIK